jgi:hypothetical protein
MVEFVRSDGIVIGIIIKNGYRLDGDKIEFVTPNDYSLQVGYMCRPNGYKVVPHSHNSVKRETTGTQEVLFIKEGKIKIDFFSFDRQYLESRILAGGDLVFLAGAGHGITVLEDATIVEVKNGPFVPGSDKERFNVDGYRK